MKFYAKYTGLGLNPMYNSDYESMKECKLKVGQVYEIEVKKKRNYKFHKKYFALLNLCFQNQEVFETLDELRFYLTVKTGHYKRVDTGKGEMIVPKSISFAKMDNIEFDQLYQDTITVICNFIGIDKGTLIDEILNFT